MRNPARIVSDKLKPPAGKCLKRVKRLVKGNQEQLNDMNRRLDDIERSLQSIEHLLVLNDVSNEEIQDRLNDLADKRGQTHEQDGRR